MQFVGASCPAGEADFKLPLSHDTLVDLVDKGKRAWCGWGISSKSLAVTPTQSLCGGWQPARKEEKASASTCTQTAKNELRAVRHFSRAVMGP
jgi:hypothetical protein